MNSDPAPAFVQAAPWLALALFGFTFFWCFVVFALSRISGWAALVSAYPAGDVLTPNARWRGQSAVMNGNIRYSNALTLIADARAVHFSIFPLLRPGHDPFAVPWEDLRSSRRRVFFVERIALSFARAPDVTLQIWPKLAERLAQASGGRFTVPPPQ